MAFSVSSICLDKTPCLCSGNLLIRELVCRLCSTQDLFPNVKAFVAIRTMTEKDVALFCLKGTGSEIIIVEIMKENINVCQVMTAAQHPILTWGGVFTYTPRRGNPPPPRLEGGAIYPMAAQMVLDPSSKPWFHPFNTVNANEHICMEVGVFTLFGRNQRMAVTPASER